MIEQIIIASVTKMAKGLCIGGYVLPEDWSIGDLTLGATRSVRLIPAGALWHSYTNNWKPGQIINAEIAERANLVLPHTEDVTLLRWRGDGCTVGYHAADAPCTCAGRGPATTYPLVLRDIAVRSALTGSVNDLFHGKISRKLNGRAVVADHTLDHSTEWWIPEVLSNDFNMGDIAPIRIVSSQYQNAAILEAKPTQSLPEEYGTWTFKYVGINPICKRKVFDYITPETGFTLVCRMSLARWFAGRNDQEKVCYADVSSIWIASHDRSSFVALECESPREDGQCACEVVPSNEISDDIYRTTWGLIQNPNTDPDDLPF